MTDHTKSNNSNTPVSPQGHEPGSGTSTCPTTARRIIAWIAILLLIGLYAATFIAALLSRPGAGRLFRFCLGMTIAVPIFAWITIWAAGVISHRHTIASMDLLNSNPEARKEMEDAVRQSGRNSRKDNR